jgi:TIR domain
MGHKQKRYGIRVRSGQAGRSRAHFAIFLSHSSRDAWLARQIKKEIETNIPGARVWLDEMSLTGGEEIIAALRKGIDQANELVVLVSNESLKSQWVAWEIGMAAAWNKRITPLLNNVDYDAMAPLKGVKSYELNQFDKFLVELKERAVQHR